MLEVTRTVRFHPSNDEGPLTFNVFAVAIDTAGSQMILGETSLSDENDEKQYFIGYILYDEMVEIVEENDVGRPFNDIKREFYHRADTSVTRSLKVQGA